MSDSWTYSWNPLPDIRSPMPDTLAVSCPQCRKRARFDFALVLQVDRKDVAYFRHSSYFDFAEVEDTFGRHSKLAVFFPGLNSRNLESVPDLPQGYADSAYRYAGGEESGRRVDVGVICCPECRYQEKHGLQWPADAYYQLTYKGQVLWAFDRETAEDLLAYVRSTDRKAKLYRHHLFLRRVPSHFLSHKAREAVVRKLEALL